MVESFTYSIRDLEDLSGIPAHTIRTWERRYGIFTPSRDAGNARSYTASDVSYLNHLVALLKQGHRISTLADKSRDEISTLAKESTIFSNESELTEALCMALQEFDTVKLENLMNCLIRKEGFDAALQNKFVPFLDRVSFMLLTGVLQPFHIPLFYTSLRLKVLAACEAIAINREGERWLLMRDDEMADPIYRDIMQYLLKKVGKQVVSLGAIHAETLKTHRASLKADGYCLVASTEQPEAWVQEIIHAIDGQQGNTLVLIPGKTLDFSNSLLINKATILTGLQAAFSHTIGML